MIKRSSYWWEAAPPVSLGEDAPIPAKADVVIVGGGYSGMSIGLFSGMLGATLAQRIPVNLLLAQAWPLRAASAGATLCIYILLTERLDFDETRPFQYLAAAVAALGLTWFVRQTLRPRKEA